MTTAGTAEDRAAIQRYLAEHRVTELLYQVLESICVEKPANPHQYIVDYLSKNHAGLVTVAAPDAAAAATAEADDDYVNEPAYGSDAVPTPPPERFVGFERVLDASPPAAADHQSPAVAVAAGQPTTVQPTAAQPTAQQQVAVGPATEKSMAAPAVDMREVQLTQIRAHSLTAAAHGRKEPGAGGCCAIQ